MRTLAWIPRTIVLAAASFILFAFGPAAASAQQPATRAQAEQDPI